MPIEDYRIAFTWFSQAQLDESYRFDAFPVQADQKHYPWLPRPLNEADVVAEGTELRTGGDGAAAFVGPQNGVLPLYLPTAAMLAHLLQTKMQSKASIRCTYSYFNRTDNQWHCDWVIVNKRDLFPAQFSRASGGTRRYELLWTRRRSAPSGPALEVVIAPSTETPTTSSPLDYVLEVTNVGDWETFGDLVLLVALPNNTRWQLSNITAVSFDIQYSANGGSSYSDTPPVPLSDSTHLRLTRTTALDAADVATVTLMGEVVDVGQLLLAVEASTTGAVSVDDESDLTAV